MRPERFEKAKAALVTRSVRRRRATIFLALLFVFVTPTAGSHPASTPPPSAPAYDALSFAQELQNLKTNLNSAGPSTDALRIYRDALPKSWPVDAAGRYYDVPSGPLISHLNRAERLPAERAHELSQALAYLDSLAAEASSFSNASALTTNSARSKLDAILSRPECTHAKQQSWYAKARNQIDDFFLKLLDRVFRGVGNQKTFGYILLWLGIAAAAVLIAYWVFRNWFRSARVAEMELAGAAVPARSWQEWVFAARDAAARSDYRMAIHCAYWAGIARLQDLGVLSPDRARTPREYLRALTSGWPVLAQDAAVRRQALAQMTSRLESTWYGYQLATETDFRDSLAQLEKLGCRLP
jgi:Domain of unknown function (DUF4129)